MTDAARDDVCAERAAWAAAMEAVHARLARIETVFLKGVPLADGDALALELRRFGEAIAGARMGLHRDDGGTP